MRKQITRFLPEMPSPICEIFSFQGEGLYIEFPQTFVRFAGCNIKCGYCDSSYSALISEKTEYYAAVCKLYKDNKKKFIFGKPSVALTGGYSKKHFKKPPIVLQPSIDKNIAVMQNLYKFYSEAKNYS